MTFFSSSNAIILSPLPWELGLPRKFTDTPKFQQLTIYFVFETIFTKLDIEMFDDFEDLLVHASWYADAGI